MPTLEQRVNELENQIRLMLDRQERISFVGTEPWWKRHSGAFQNNRLYDEAMRLGNEYRRAQPTSADSPDEFID
jgi:hypothetical protein